MGGGQGLGPFKSIMLTLERLSTEAQSIFVAGTNKKLYKYLSKKTPKLKKQFKVLSYSEDIDELMDLSDIIITKPGGITTSEALAKGLPLLIVNPIPGQEAKNTKFLVNSGAAIKANNQDELKTLLENLFAMPSKLNVMSEAAMGIGKPLSSLDTARMIIELINSKRKD